MEQIVHAFNIDKMAPSMRKFDTGDYNMLDCQ